MASIRTELTSSSRRKPHPLRGYFFIASAALFWGISATLGRAIFTGHLVSGARALHPIDPLILAQSRTAISFLVLAPLLLLRRGVKGIAMPRRDVGLCILLGVLGMAISNYFYYLAIERTNVATAIILQYTAPIWVLTYMVLRGLQRASFMRLASVALAVIGSGLAIGIIGPGQFKLDMIGVIAAQVAAVSFAFYNILGSRMVARHDRWQVLFYVFLGAVVFWLVVNPPWKIIAADYSREQWMFMGVFAITSILLPFSLYFGGLQYLDATRAIVTSSLEPVFSIIIAAVFLSELLGPLQIVGIVVVLLATVLVQLPDKGKTGSAAVMLEPIE